METSVIIKLLCVLSGLGLASVGGGTLDTLGTASENESDMPTSTCLSENWCGWS